jgi:hypothetical protein
MANTINDTKNNRCAITHWVMRQEHITLKNVEISELFDRIKKTFARDQTGHNP